MVIYVRLGFENKRKIFPKFLRPNVLSGLLWCSRTRVATVGIKAGYLPSTPEPH